jgi:hypothetical protein
MPDIRCGSHQARTTPTNTSNRLHEATEIEDRSASRANRDTRVTRGYRNTKGTLGERWGAYGEKSCGGSDDNTEKRGRTHAPPPPRLDALRLRRAIGTVDFKSFANPLR